MKTKNYNCIIAASGGLDSTTLLYYLVNEEKKNPLAVYFDYGHRMKNAEEKLISYHCKKLGVDLIKVNVKEIFNPLKTMDGAILLLDDNDKNLSEFKTNSLVPNRNLLFLVYLCNMAISYDIEELIYGANCNDITNIVNAFYPDCTPEFVELVNNIFKLYGYKQRVRAPYVDWNYTKIDIVKLALKNNVPIDYTMSCYRPTYDEVNNKVIICNNCTSCLIRENALKENSLEYKKEISLNEIM